MPVLHGMSALSYYRTPLQVERSQIDPSVLLDGTEEGKRVYRLLTEPCPHESNSTRMVRLRARGDLMGIPLPLELCPTEPCSMRPNRLVIPRRLPRHQSPAELVSLGGGLMVPTVPQLFLELARGRTIVELGLLMMEACGLFAVFHETAQARAVLKALRVVEEECAFEKMEAWEERNDSEGFIGNRKPYCNACYDESGKRLFFLDDCGGAQPWRRAMTTIGKVTDMWARPPLTTANELIDYYSRCVERGIPAARKALQAAKLVLDGAASPLEARFAIMQFAPVSLGGDAWPRPFLNRRVRFLPELRKLAGRDWCSCDELWDDLKVDIELNGRAFHADERGFSLESGRRAALEAMGYRVLEITHGQMEDDDSFETISLSFADVIGFREAPRTSAFCKRRKEFHRQVMAFRF